MKTYTQYLAVILAVLTATQPALAAKIGDDAVTLGRPGSSADKTIRMGAGRVIWSQGDSKLKFSNDAGATVKDLGTGGGGAGGITLLTDTDADFEAAASSNWTASGGSFTKATATPNLLYGAKSGLFNASSSGQTLSNTLVAPAPGMLSGTGQAYCYFKTAATDYKLQVFDGTTAIAERVITPSTSATKQATSDFTFPASGTVRLRIISQSDAADLAIDNCFLGQTDSVSISQAELYGTLSYAPAASCVPSWAVTVAGTYVSPAPDSDCPTAVVTGKVVAPPTKIPAVIVSGPGEYAIEMSGSFNSGAATNQASWRLSDGTQTSFMGTNVDTNGVAVSSVLRGNMSYTDGAPHTIELQGTMIGTTGTLDAQNTATGHGLVIRVWRYPTASQIVQNFDTAGESFSATIYNAGWTQTGAVSDFTQSGSPTVAVHENSGSGTVLQDGTNPGFTFSIGSLGKRRVCVSSELGNSAGTSLLFTMVDGVEIGRIAVATTVVSAVSPCYSWVPTAIGPHTVKVQNQNTGGTGSLAAGSAQFFISVTKETNPVSTPLVVNTIVSDYAGILKLESLEFDGGSATTNCTAGPCTIRQTTSAWATSIARSGAGNYLLTRTAGSFGARPMCFCTVMQQGTGAGIGCSLNYPSPTTVEIYTGAGVDTYGTVQCIGPR